MSNVVVLHGVKDMVVGDAVWHERLDLRGSIIEIFDDGVYVSFAGRDPVRYVVSELSWLAWRRTWLVRPVSRERLIDDIADMEAELHAFITHSPHATETLVLAREARIALARQELETV